MLKQFFTLSSWRKCLKIVGTFIVGTNYKGLPLPFKIPECMILRKLVTIKMLFNNFWQNLRKFPQPPVLSSPCHQHPLTNAPTSTQAC